MTTEEFKQASKITGGFEASDPSIPCIVLGGGPNVWQEYNELVERLTLGPRKAFHVLAVNAVGAYAPICHYWFSLHCDYLVVWALTRKLMYRGNGPYKSPQLITTKKTGQFAGSEPFQPIDISCSIGGPTIQKSAKHGGSLEDSGFFAMCLAVAAGYHQVYLVGCPADDSGHVFIPKWTYLQHDKNAIRVAWEDTLNRYPILRERVRSRSGLTKELLSAEFIYA